MSDTDEKIPLQEIIVTHRSENSGKESSTFEKWIKILSLIAIPVVVAFIGAGIQSSISSSNVKSEYVKLAVSILTDNSTKEEIRGWAVDLLNDNSETKLDPTLANKLKAGDILLPATLAIIEDEIDEFMLKKWIPTFVGFVVNNKDVEKDWNEVVQANDKEKARILLEDIANAMAVQILKQRNELVKPAREALLKGDISENTVGQVNEMIDRLKSKRGNISNNH
jgi:hypothetical protein